MRSLLRPALALFGLLTLITGALYPALVTGFAQIAFPREANGSLLHDGDKVAGSTLIGQPFSEPGYFWSRPSATGPYPYNGGSSSGSNVGPTNPALKEAVSKRLESLRSGEKAVPVDLVTSSASGLDPHITPAAAFWQVARVAQTRHLDEARVRALVEKHVELRTFGILGEPRVNVLLLNRALDLEAGGA